MATSTKPMTHGPKVPGSDPAANIRKLAREAIGTDHGRNYWMAHPSAELGGKTPEDLIRDGKADVVQRYLQSALEGDFG